MSNIVILLFIIFIITFPSITCPDPVSLQPATAQTTQSEAAMFEAALNALAANNLLPRSIVAVIDPEPRRRNPNKLVNNDHGDADADGEEKPMPPFDPAKCGSVGELAQVFGLGVFEQSGICVIAPPERLDLQAIYSSQWSKSDTFDKEFAYTSLLTGLDSRQIKALGSTEGLSYLKLTPRQRELLSMMIPSNTVLWLRGAEGFESDRRMSGADIPLNGLVLKCRLMPEAVLYAGNDAIISLGDRRTHLDKMREEQFGWIIGSTEAYSAPPVIPNLLKASDLDYARSELQAITEISGKLTMRDLIFRIARDTGLSLMPCLGAENVKLFVYSGRKSAGSVLKAVMLAVQGSWRRVDNGFLLTADTLGISQPSAVTFERLLISEIRSEDMQDMRYDPAWLESMLSLLPWDPDFPLTLAQARLIANWDYTGRSPITMETLIPEQNELIKQRLNELRQSPQWKEPKSPYTHIIPQFTPKLILESPEMGVIHVDGGLVLIKSRSEFHQRMDARLSSNVTMPINLPVRGLMLSPDKGDTPESIMKIMTQHGFNTLYLKVFSDGYTIFPSKVFPSREWVKDSEYLKTIIKTAHEKSIKVYAVVDVLRWSNGEKNPWIRSKPDLLDYDVLGRSQSEWAASGFISKQRVRGELCLVGDARMGDVVTPLSPAVNDMLSTLINELSGYWFDGLALDHTCIYHTNMGTLYTEVIGGIMDSAGITASSGQPGFNPVSRNTFLRNFGIDPIDMSFEYAELTSVIPDNSISPLMKVVESSAFSRDLVGKWTEFYKKSCDSLLESLLAQWYKTKKDVPVWIIDTYSEDLNMSHDWIKFKGRISGLMNTLAMDSPTYPGHGMKRLALLRASDSVGTLMFGSMLAQLSGNTFPGMLNLVDEARKLYAGQGIVIDLACSENRRSEFLRMIKPASVPSVRK
ncbi:MAG: hypothetical protein ACYC0V_08295 [Armatimonadota bacterium]